MDVSDLAITDRNQNIVLIVPPSDQFQRAPFQDMPWPDIFEKLAYY